MIKHLHLFFIIIITIGIASCHNPSTKTAGDTTPKPSAAIYTAIGYTDSIQVKMALDTTLSYKDGMDYDSIIAVDYEGREDNLTDILDRNGDWINTIKQFKRLSPAQCKKIQSIIASSSTYDNANNYSCFVPHLGLAYFQYGEVKAHTAICLSCMGIESTATLGNYTKFSQINTTAADQIATLCEELGFSFCREKK